MFSVPAVLFLPALVFSVPAVFLVPKWVCGSRAAVFSGPGSVFSVPAGVFSSCDGVLGSRLALKREKYADVFGSRVRCFRFPRSVRLGLRCFWFSRPVFSVPVSGVL